MKSRVVILGGGITGLSTCHWIEKFSQELSLSTKTNQPEVLVLEKSNRFGGFKI
jgi:protoporphyrinogen oxidase